MSEAQRVGQLLMVDYPSTSVASDHSARHQRRLHVGSVILDGNSSLGIGQHARAITTQLQADAPSSAGLLISTDQEGGLVQRLRGPGFSTIPVRWSQGRLAPATLHGRCEDVGRQLAPPASTSTSRRCSTPCRRTRRQPADRRPRPRVRPRPRDRAPRTVWRSRKGLAEAGIAATVKHFPGLGRVTGNTDTTSGRDRQCDHGTDPYLAPFAGAITGERRVGDDVDGDLQQYRPGRAGRVLGDDHHRLCCARPRVHAAS